MMNSSVHNDPKGNSSAPHPADHEIYLKFLKFKN